MQEVFEPLELNEENVVKVYKKCRYTDDSADYTPAYMYSNRNDVVYLFDTAKLKENAKAIEYLLGQTIVAHNGEERFRFPYLSLKHDNQMWTEDHIMLSKLIMLGIGSGIITSIVPPENMVNIKRSIKKSLSPNEDGFEAWWEDNRVKWN